MVADPVPGDLLLLPYDGQECCSWVAPSTVIALSKTCLCSLTTSGGRRSQTRQECRGSGRRTLTPAATGRTHSTETNVKTTLMIVTYRHTFVRRPRSGQLRLNTPLSGPPITKAILNDRCIRGAEKMLIAHSARKPSCWGTGQTKV